jgi:hypothetical protein
MEARAEHGGSVLPLIRAGDRLSPGKRNEASVSPKELLALNGDFKDSPLLQALRRFHAFASAKGIPYCVIGGLAVIRNGASRTTTDIDILSSRTDWERGLPLPDGFIPNGADALVDSATGADIDLIFIEDDWGTPFPDPRSSGEFDAELGATFLGLRDLIQLKAFVYIAKLREDGKAIAAKDLSDVAELIRANLDRLSADSFADFAPAARDVCVEALAELRRSLMKKPTRY